MLVYVIHYTVILILSFFSSLKENVKKPFVVAVFLCLAVFAALRDHTVDRDYSTYVEIFSKLTNVDYFTPEYLAFYEPAFYVLPVLCKVIFGQDYIVAVFSMFSLLGVFLKLKAIYLSNSTFLSIILYVSSFFFLHEMTQIRAGVATGILMLGIKEIYNKRFFTYCLYVIGACVFHYSSIIFLPLFFIGAHRLNKPQAFGLLGLALFFSVLKINILDFMNLSSVSPKIELYNKLADVGMHRKINIWNIGFLINLTMLIFLLFKSEKLAQRNPYFNIMLKFYLLSIVVYLLLSSMPVFAIRVSELFGVIQFCLFPSAIFAFRRVWIGYFLVIFLSIINLYIYIYHSKIFDPYSSWLEIL